MELIGVLNVFFFKVKNPLDPRAIGTHYAGMTQKRIYTLVGSLLLLAGLVYGLTSISVSKEAGNASAWTVRCDKDEAGKNKYCETFSSVAVKETGARLAEFAVGYPPTAKGAARGVVTLPLGMMLEPGAAMQVDDGGVYTFSMRQCSANGCHAFIDMKDEVLKQFKSGKIVTLTFVLGDKKLALGLPLSGFSNSFKGLK